MESTHISCLLQNCNPHTPHTPPLWKALWTLLQIIALIFPSVICFFSFFHHLYLSFFTISFYQTLFLCISPLLNLLFKKKISSILMCLSLPFFMSLYFPAITVVDWKGGLCHFYLLPHWFCNSLCVCAGVCLSMCKCGMIADVWTVMRCVWLYCTLISVGSFSWNYICGVCLLEEPWTLHCRSGDVSLQFRIGGGW